MSTTIKLALDDFLLACRSEGKSPKTMRSYQDILKSFVDFVGDIPIDTLSPDHIRGYINTLASRPGVHGQFSNHSIHKHYSVIRTFVRWMYHQRMIAECLTDFTKAPRQSEDLPEILSDEEVEKLFNYLKERKIYRDQVIFEMFLDTGIRQKELVGINLDDVHVDKYFIRVNGKGGKEDIVPLGKTLAEHLRTYINSDRMNTALPGETALFVNRAGERLKIDGVNILVRRALAHIGKSGKAGPHILRHTFATMFLQRGGSLEALRCILRHTDLRVTQRYLHLLTADIAAEHQKASPLDRMDRKQAALRVRG